MKYTKENLFMFKFIEETIFLTLPDGKNVPVRNLDSTIQEKIKQYDLLREEYAAKRFEVTNYAMALKQRQQEIAEEVNKLYPPEQPETQELQEPERVVLDDNSPEIRGGQE